MRSLAVLVCLVPSIALAQPGPGPALGMPELHGFAIRIHDADATLRSPTRDANARIRAARDYADALQHLATRVSISPVAGGPSSIAPGAEHELQTLTGLTFAQVAPAVPRAWQRCADEVRALHALDGDGRECLEHVRRYTAAAAVGDGYALPPPPAFLAISATPAATQAIYVATATRLAANANDATSRRALGAMQLATGDYTAAIATLQPLAGDYDVDLTIAVALAAANDSNADARFAALIQREPARPEAYYDRALAARGRGDQEQDATLRTAQRRRQFLELCAFLCTRDAAHLAGPPNAADTAAHDAEAVQWQALGGSHWSWRSEKPRPAPFLPEALLPASMHDGPGPGPTPSATCPDALRLAR